jgi:hypothetical protein
MSTVIGLIKKICMLKLDNSFLCLIRSQDYILDELRGMLAVSYLIGQRK